MKTTRTIISLLLAITFLQSCSYKNRNILFKTQKEINSNKAVTQVNGNDKSTTTYRHRIKIGDRLLIRFLNNYDIGGSAGQSATSGANTSGGESSYLVNYDSTVVLPLVGRLNLIGLTRLEAAVRLEKEYGKFVVNPIIDVNIATLHVTVLGEVNAPGIIQLDKENTTLVDIIAKCSGIKETGRKNGIKIIRGTEIIFVDLRKIEALNSEAIVMHDNDIVYVEPYKLKADAEPYVTVQPVLSIFMSVLQTALFVTNVYFIYKK